MSVETEINSILKSKHLWIIDDDIPIELLDYENDDMKSGERPIDRGTLMGLLQNDKWEDSNVKTLVDELVNKAENVTAFTQPVAALNFLNLGRTIPDGIVFDLKYRLTMPKTSTEYLEEILEKCVSVVQVYTEESADTANRELEKLRSKYSSRLEEPISKSDTDAGILALALDGKIKNSLSAQFAGTIRRLTAQAVENILVKIDDLPLNVAVKLLAGEPEMPNEADIVEFLSIKVGEVIESNRDLSDAVKQYAIKYKNISEDKVNKFVEEMVNLLAANVRERILYNGWMYKVLQSAWKNAGQVENAEQGEMASEIVKNFFAFRLYDRPSDDLVRTGDIVRLAKAKSTTPTSDRHILHIIITPPCDLSHFWKKTRGVLSLVRLYPMTRKLGLKKMREYTNDKLKNVTSVTARNPMILPSIPLSDNNCCDYMLYKHDVCFKGFNGTALFKPEEGMRKEARFNRNLTYSELSELGTELIRICRISEPFLTGILDDLKGSLFRSGVPEFPEQEVGRFNKLFGQ
ncbi:MAG: hypothetical protein MUO64_15355 [Anaerolineales bacterium]|nr:hypothetical protein [Anaerolineales bacterium]